MRAIVLTIALTAGLAPAAAAQSFDRTKIPPPGKPPELRVPSWTTAKLANGAELIVSERHGLPLVSLTITFIGGANQFEPAAKQGLSGVVAAMMREGTKTRDGEALAKALQLVGSPVTVTIADESGSIGFSSTTERFGDALNLMADMLLNSTFPTDALERLRSQRLVTLTQANAQPRAIGTRVFKHVLYGSSHPYGQDVTEASIKAISRDDVVSFQKSYFQPGRAIITVVGDITPAAAKTAVDKALAAWPAGGSRPAFTYPALPATHPITIFLVDKPGAAQSTFALGNPGPPRSTKDYVALQVMNMMLGGNIQSRLSANIREEKGYSYGVTSSFAYGKGPGAFRAGADIVSAKSDAALVEFIKELRGIQGSRPVTDEELATAKDALVQRLPGQFSSLAATNGAITSILTQDLPADFYQQYSKAIAAVTKEDIVRVAKQYIDMDHLSIIIVGDRASIEGPLKATNIAPIVVLDSEGNPKQ